jgi:hypothetical protein
VCLLWLQNTVQIIRRHFLNKDIYAAPKSNLDESRSQLPIRIYSPTQVACGTIGGPVGLVYFLMANFEALGQQNRKKRTLIFGIIFIIALIVILPFLPDSVPSAPFTIAYIIIAKQVAEKYQMKKQDIINSDVYEFHSNWRVLGLGLLCLVGSLIAVVGPLIILMVAGIWEPV